ncbi:MAG: peptidase [Rariglobus sp.]|jgi:uncharacterized iron-regulated membrane protein|nr:peptidase [Rariglobus sp.]
MSVRKVVFWLHLTAGLVAGVIIAVMSATGVALAFEHEIVAWAERDVRRVDAPASATALPLDDLLAKARAAAPENAKLSGVTVSRDPRDAVAVNFGREAGVYYVNHYTGDTIKPASMRTADLMRTLVEWHRYLGRSGEKRPLGKAVTGACNLAFLFLACSGLWLWWPRAWNARALRPSLWFVRGASGKTRDWNWHNVTGFWSLPVLIVLTISGAVIGYKWASDLVYRAAGETPQPPGALSPALSADFAPPSPDARPISYAAALTHIQSAFPDWKTITLRQGLPPRRGAAPATPPSAPRGPQPYSATVVEAGKNYVAASTVVVINAFTGDLLDRAGYPEQTTGRKARTWMRYLHTGQALGWIGQLVAALASLGGLLLVYTGFALAWRRFFSRKGTAD